MFKKKPPSRHADFRPKWFSFGNGRRNLAEGIRTTFAVLVRAISYSGKPVSTEPAGGGWKPLLQRILRPGNVRERFQGRKTNFYNELKRWKEIFLIHDVHHLLHSIPRVVRRWRPILIKGATLFIVLAALGDASTRRSKVQEALPLVAKPAPLPPKTQAALFPFRASPFYYPFKAKPTSMNKTEPFSQIAGAKHNSHGFRAPEYTIAHPPDVFRIVVIGDEVTYGSGVSMTEMFTSQLQNLLNQQCSKVRFEVIPLGGIGHRLADNLIKLKVHAQSLEPDLVIFQLSFNDVEFENYLNAYAIRGGKDYLNFVNHKIDQVMSKGSVDRKVVSESIFEIQNWSLKQAVPVAFVVFPFVDNDPAGRNFSHYSLNDPRAARYLNRFSEISNDIRVRGFPVLDLIGAFRDSAEDRYLAVSINDASPNAYAHRLAAESLATFLQDQKLARCSISKHPAGTEWKWENTLRQKAAHEWTSYNQDYRAQLSFFEQIRKLYPGDAWTMSLLADVYYGLEQWENASRSYTSVAELAPDLSAPWYQLAQCTYEPSQRVMLLERMLQTVPFHNLAAAQLADHYTASNRTLEACKLVSRIIETPVYQEQYEAGLQLYKLNGCDKKSPATAALLKMPLQ